MRSIVLLSLVAAAGMLAGCGSAPKSGRDGVVASDIPADVAATPDATPRVETIKPGGANKPYEVLGKSYTPETRDVPIREKGIASWYGKKFHGRKTASGELYNMYAMTAAHPTMPLPSYARVRNPKNGREIIVRVNDRGPFHAGRVIDLSYTAAVKLGIQNGIAPVEVERLNNEAIRTGAWKRDGDTAVAAVAAIDRPAAESAVAVVPPSRMMMSPCSTRSAAQRAMRAFWGRARVWRRSRATSTGSTVPEGQRTAPP